MPILQWLNREEHLTAASRAEYRLLKADSDLSYGDPNTENMLIQGDNLEALKALLPYYAADDDIGVPVYIEITQECAKCGRLHFINEKIDT